VYTFGKAVAFVSCLRTRHFVLLMQYESLLRKTQEKNEKFKYV
jgi:hypothetical protein